MPDTDVTARVLDKVKRYVEIETPSGDVAHVLELAEIIAGELERAGAAIEWFNAPGWGRHLRASVAGEDPDLAPLVIMGHIDTVHARGALERMPFTVQDGRASGPGIFDMKTGVALAVHALESLHERGVRPFRTVRLLLTCDEETGSRTSRKLIEDTARTAGAVLVLEPSLPGGAAKTARKGVATFRLYVHGRAAHAGIEPERGASAITELAHQILRILSFADGARGTTLSVGVVRGGSAVNVIAAEAYAEIDVRFGSMAEAERIRALLLSLQPLAPGVTLEIEEHDSRPPLERTPAVVELYEKARATARAIGFELGEGSTGGGSDGCFTGALGIPTLDGLGTQGGGAHAVDEHILLEDVPRRVALLTRLIETL